MATVTFDKLSYAQLLRSGGFTNDQAEACAHALDGALRDSVATKSDLESESAALRRDIEKYGDELRAEIAETKAELKNDIAVAVSDLRREMVAQKYDLLRWLIPLIVGQAALVVALTKLL